MYYIILRDSDGNETKHMPREDYESALAALKRMRDVTLPSFGLTNRISFIREED